MTFCQKCKGTGHLVILTENTSINDIQIDKRLEITHCEDCRGSGDSEWPDM